MIHVITGNGKGKTSAAAGMAIRMAGYGKKVLFAQLFKGSESGEINILKSIDCITVKRLSREYGFVESLDAEERKSLFKEHDEILLFALSNDFDMIILDEAMLGINSGMADKEKILKIMNKNCETVLTGRDCPEEIADKADYISEIIPVRHPFEKGVDARRGIEY